MKRYLLTLILLLACASSKAQLVQDYFFKNMDLSYINPAALTMDGGLKGNIQYNRSSLDNVNTEVGGQLQLHSNFAGGHGAGITLISQKAGIFTGTGLGAGYAYGINLSEGQKLSLGARFNYFKNSINRAAVINANVSDPVLTGESYNQGNLLVVAGLLYQFRGLTLSAGGPEFLPMKGNAVAQRDVNAYAAYTFTAGSIAIRPNVYYEKYRNLGDWFETSLFTTFNQKMYLEASYTSQKSARFRAGFDLHNLTIGYGYDAGNSGRVNGLSKSGHQLFLQFKAGDLFRK